MRCFFHLCISHAVLGQYFRTSPSIVQTAAGNNGTRVLKPRLPRCQYLRPKEYTSAKGPSSRVPIPPCEAHLFARESGMGRTDGREKAVQETDGAGQNRRQPMAVHSRRHFCSVVLVNSSRASIVFTIYLLRLTAITFATAQRVAAAARRSGVQSSLVNVASKIWEGK